MVESVRTQYSANTNIPDNRLVDIAVGNGLLVNGGIMDDLEPEGQLYLEHFKHELVSSRQVSGMSSIDHDECVPRILEPPFIGLAKDWSSAMRQYIM